MQNILKEKYFIRINEFFQKKNSFDFFFLLKVLFHNWKPEDRGYNLSQALWSLCVRKNSSEQAALAGYIHTSNCWVFVLVPLAGSEGEGELEGWRLANTVFNGWSYLGFTIIADSRGFLCVLRLGVFWPGRAGWSVPCLFLFGVFFVCLDSF